MKDWKKDRIYYNLTQESKENLYRSFLDKFVTEKELSKYRQELKSLKLLDKKSNKDLAITTIGIVHLYALVRKYQFKHIVETGVSRGMSSATFLYAMEKNKKGLLISVDHCKEHPEEIGSYVPKNLKHRWEFAKGKTKDVLPMLRIPKDGIDIFCHDSLHSYDNQMFEYKWAWERLKKGGLLISHDIGASNAFFDFAKEYKRPYYFIKTSAYKQFLLGVIVR